MMMTGLTIQVRSQAMALAVYAIRGGAEGLSYGPCQTAPLFELKTFGLMARAG